MRIALATQRSNLRTGGYNQLVSFVTEVSGALVCEGKTFAKCLNYFPHNLSRMSASWNLRRTRQERRNMEDDESIDRWFKFIEWYNKNYSVPLSDLLIPNQQITGFRAMGSPIGMTNLSKREWNKLMGDNVPRKGNSLAGCHEKKGKKKK